MARQPKHAFDSSEARFGQIELNIAGYVPGAFRAIEQALFYWGYASGVPDQVRDDVSGTTGQPPK